MSQRKREQQPQCDVAKECFDKPEIMLYKRVNIKPITVLLSLNTMSASMGFAYMHTSHELSAQFMGSLYWHSAAVLHWPES